VHGDPTGR